MKLEIGKCIKNLRLQKGVTQEALANYLGVSYQAVSKWETEANIPDITLLPKLSMFFGVTIDDFFKISKNNHFERINNMLLNERRISDENFVYAQRFLEQVVLEDEKNVEALCLLSQIYNHRAKSDHELAKKYAEQGLCYEPFKRALHVSLIEASNGITGDGYIDNHRGISEFYSRFVEKYPKYFLGYKILMKQLLADGQFEEVEQLIEEARKLEDNYVFYIYEGDIQLGRGNREAAINLWNQTVEKFGDIWQAYCHRADRLVKLGLIDEAIKDYEYCFEMQVRPRLIDGLLSVAPLYEQRGDYSKAIETWKRYIAVLQEDYQVTEGEQINAPNREIERLSKI